MKQNHFNLRQFRIAFAIALSLFAAELNAASYGPENFRQTIDNSEAIVVGSVVATEARRKKNEFGDDLIMTKVTLAVDESWKDGKKSKIEIEVEGGTIGENKLEVSDMPEPRKGQKLVVLTRRTKSGDLVPTDRGRSIMEVDQNRQVRGRGIALDDLRVKIKKVTGQ